MACPTFAYFLFLIEALDSSFLDLVIMLANISNFIMLPRRSSTFYLYRTEDIVEVMKEELTTNPYARVEKNLQWRFKAEVDPANPRDRVVSELFSAEWAKYTEKAWNLDPDEFLNPYGIFIDGTELDDLGRQVALPVVFAPLNFKNEVLRRGGCRRVVAWIPGLKCSKAQRKKKKVRIACLKIYHQAMEEVLRPIKVRGSEQMIQTFLIIFFQNKSFLVCSVSKQEAIKRRGYELVINGINRFLIPCVPFIALDGMEARRVTCTYNSPKCQRPCWMCEIGKSQLGVKLATAPIRYRPYRKIKYLVQEALLDGKADALQKLHETSIHPIMVIKRERAVLKSCMHISPFVAFYLLPRGKIPHPLPVICSRPFFPLHSSIRMHSLTYLSAQAWVESSPLVGRSSFISF
jgi:hypothetical protein